MEDLFGHTNDRADSIKEGKEKNLPLASVKKPAISEETHKKFKSMFTPTPVIKKADDEIEEEEDDLSGNIMEQPFNPAKIDITTKTLTIDLLIKRMQAEPMEIDLSPAFQRKGDLWDAKKQSQLIESLLINFPLPAFYFDGTNDNQWLVVDGLQRLSALRNFVILKTLKLTGLEFLNKLEGLGFGDLQRNQQRQIEEAQITAYVINKGTPEEVKFNIFKRINTGGLILNTQEIRHALNQGIPAQFVEELAGTKEFKQATGGISPDRMQDREFVTRFLAFRMSPVSAYKPDLDPYMNQKMGEIKLLTEEQREEIKSVFISSMKAAYGIFDKWAFRKVFNLQEPRKPLNKALFEVWSVELSKLTEEQQHRLISKRQEVLDRFMKLMSQDDKFVTSISSATGHKSRVNYRYAKIREIIHHTLES